MSHDLHAHGSRELVTYDLLLIQYYLEAATTGVGNHEEESSCLDDV